MKYLSVNSDKQCYPVSVSSELAEYSHKFELYNTSEMLDDAH